MSTPKAFIEAVRDFDRITREASEALISRVESIERENRRISAYCVELAASNEKLLNDNAELRAEIESMRAAAAARRAA